MKVAVVSGSTGQIGSYLCELLLQEGYDVYGLKHHNDNIYPPYIKNLLLNPKFKLFFGDISDKSFVNSFITKYRPNLFLNCAAQSNVVSSFTSKDYTMMATGESVIYCLDAIKNHSPTTRFITLGSPLMFGNSPVPQNELSLLDAKSPYAEAKIIAYRAAIKYRQKYNLFACNAICFNSESPRRSIEYVSRKITNSAARIKLGLQDKLILGNINSLRDFSHSQDTATAIYQIITHRQPDDFVIASGKTHSIQEIVELAFSQCNLNWKQCVEIDPKYFRNEKENVYCGDISKIYRELQWQPTIKFEDLIKEMIEYDLAITKQLTSKEK
jgi:GDPmannose 4,6-dehydratase